MKRCLVTGASGFVGANLARRLLDLGHETHLLLRPSYQAWRLEEISSEVVQHEVDLNDCEGVAKAVRSINPEWVFHLGAYGAYPTQTSFDGMVATNLVGSAALMDACAESDVEAFVQTGSSSEYGYQDHAAREDELIQPNSYYAITKAAATHYCQFIARQRGLNAITARLYSVYGPYEEPTRLIPTLIVHGLQGQLPKLVSRDIGRDFVYIDDAVGALLQLASAPRFSPGVVFNVCSGVQHSLESIVNTARKLMQIPIAPVWSTMQSRAWDTNMWVGSPALMAAEVQWRASVDFETGLGRTIEWFRLQPKWVQFYSSRIFP